MEKLSFLHVQTQIRGEKQINSRSEDVSFKLCYLLNSHDAADYKNAYWKRDTGAITSPPKK